MRLSRCISLKHSWGCELISQEDIYNLYVDGKMIDGTESNGVAYNLVPVMRIHSNPGIPCGNGRQDNGILYSSSIGQWSDPKMWERIWASLTLPW